MKLRRLARKPSKKVVIILIILAVTGFGVKSCFFSGEADNGPKNVNIPKELGETPTAKAEKGDLEVNIKVLGKSKIVNEQELKFNQAGTIVTANFKAGDHVTKGEILASMNKKDVYNEIEQAKLDLDNERIKYNKLLEDHDENNKNLSDSIKDLKKKITNLESEIKELSNSQEKALFDKKKDIEKSKNDLEKQKKLTPDEKDELKRTLEKKKIDLQEKLDNKESDKKKLEDDLNKEKKNLEQKIFNYNNDIENSILGIKSTNISLENDINFLNNIVGVDDDKLTGTFYSIFSNRDDSIRNKAEGKFRVAYDQYKEVIKYSKEMLEKKDHTIEDLIKMEKQYKSLYEKMMEACENITLGLKETVAASSSDNSVSSYTSATESMSSSYQSRMSSSKTKINNLQNLDSPETMKERSDRELKNIQKTYDDNLKAIEDLEKEVKKLEDSLNYDISQKDIALEKSIKDYEQLESSLPKFEREQKEAFESKEKELRDAKKDLEKKEKEYNKTLGGPNKSELLIGKNAVKQAELKLENLNEKLDKYNIKAPFDGIIRTFNYKAGSKITDNASEKIVIENPNIIEIGVNLDQVDIVKVKKDQEVRIKFDAFPGKVYEGEMGDISGTPVEKYDGVSYEIKVLLKKDGDEVIYSGMTANVEIVVDNKEDVLLIPSTAIETNDKGETYVTTKENGKNVKKKVEIGIANGKQTEILEGLKEGDEVVEINFDANKFKDDEFGGGGMYF